MQGGEDHGTFRKYVSQFGAWALAFGCCVGWGAFVMPGTTFLPVAGPVGTLIGLGIGALLMVVLAANYQFMMERVSGTGGPYTYASLAFGTDHGFLSGWFLILAYVVVLWGNATALPMIARYLLGDVFQFGFHYTIFGYDVFLGEILLSALMLALSALLCLDPRRAITCQIVFAVLLIVGITACFIHIFRNAADLSDLTPAFAPDVTPTSGLFSIVSLAPWAFVGFETISHSSGEFRFAQRKSLRIMIIALLCAFAAYAFMTLISISYIPDNSSNWAEYLSHIGSLSGIAAMPAFSTVSAVFGSTGKNYLGITAFAAIFTGLIGFATASSRLLYSIALDDLLPESFKKINPKGVPSFALLVIFLVSLPVLFLGRTAINWLVDVTTLCVIIAYMYVSASALKTAHDEGKKWSMLFGAIGFIVSCLFAIVYMVPNLLLIRTMSAESYLLITIWCILGLLWFRYMFKKKNHKLHNPSTLVWGAFLILIIYTSLIWVTQTAAEMEVRTSQNIENYYSEEVISSNDEDLRDAEEYVQQELESTNRVLRHSSMIQIGFIVAAMLIIFNIYEIMQKRAAEMELEKARAEENSRAKSLFLSNMSHDMRTPMNAIIGMAEIASRRIDDRETVEQSLHKISLSGKHLLGIINDVLDISKIESGKMKLVPEDMSLAQSLQTVKDIILPQAAEKGQTFEVYEKDILCDRVFCDSVRLNQVLLNLLSNAIKYTPENGTVSISLRQEASEQGDDYVKTQFEIRDDGIGMSEEFQEKLFTSFEREDSMRVHKTQGTGLGLAITKYIVDAMEGTIETVSSPGKGTVFTVTADLKRSENEADEALPPNGQSLAGEEGGSDDFDLTGRVFLLAEDNDINAEIATAILEDCGCSVEWAQDGAIAAEMFAQSEPGHYDAVLMDLRMPNMNGIEATKAIRAMDRADAQSIPVIAMTADAFAEDAQRCLDAGMNAHLAKPIDLELLMKTLQEHLLKKAVR